MFYEESKLIFEKGPQNQNRRKCVSFPKSGITPYKVPDRIKRKKMPDLPGVSEIELVRHYTNLSRKAYGVDNCFYPLGSCTMKYNPKINEDIANLPGFTEIHPLQDEACGCFEVMRLCEDYLKEIVGMDEITLQPAAGAHGEFTSLMMIKAYFADRGEHKRKIVLVPDSAHGTNPASAAMAGFSLVTIPSNKFGNVDVEKLKPYLNDNLAAFMLTNPNTLGLFEKEINTISELVHNAGGLLYYDGANMNAIMGITRPGDMGFDIVHLNLHKTFATPHGGGGPGSGPVGCKKILAEYLPDKNKLVKNEKSIGRIKAFYGNFGVYLKALTYIMVSGAEGLKEISENAVLNANYLLALLRAKYNAPFPEYCMHEFVLSLEKFKKETGISAADISKNLIDNGIHPPTMYFPLIVNEALMFEPTETETKETLDYAAELMNKLCDEAYSNPKKLQEAPVKMPITRPDEVKAARTPVVKYISI